MNRLRGLDSIRFLAALWVVFGHLGHPQVFPDSGLGHYAHRFMDLVFFAPAAVVVFFVVSGFCIHYPHRDGKAVHLPSYWARRLLRIAGPLLLALPLTYVLDKNSLLTHHNGVYWTLVCEAAYYALYPALLSARRRIGDWKPMIVGTLVLSAVLVASLNWQAPRLPPFGHLFNWLVYLPSWLMGCLLADKLTAEAKVGRFGVWPYRIAVVFCSWLFLLKARPDGPSLAFFINLYAIPVYFWMAQEITYYRTREPWAWMESAGFWSYSLYLMHLPFGNGAVAALQALTPKPNEFLLFGVKYAAAFGGSYLFFRVMEKPSHRWAQQAGEWMKRRFPAIKTVPVPAVPEGAVVVPATAPVPVESEQRV